MELPSGEVLENALADATQDPAKLEYFYTVLSESILIVVREDAVKDPSAGLSLKKKAGVDLIKVESEGLTYIPVFSSLGRLKQILPGRSDHFPIGARELIAESQGVALFLNPGSEPSRPLSTGEVNGIASGFILNRSTGYLDTNGAPTIVGQASTPPKALIDILTDAFKKMKDVKQAYVTQIFNPATDHTPHTLVAIDATKDAAVAVKAIKTLTTPLENSGAAIDVMSISTNSLSTYFTNECEPFYKRKVLGLF